MIKGIDVAKWQGNVSWPEVKRAGVQFAILKIIDETGNTEEAFERNYSGATEQKIPVGVYNYSYATSVDMAQAEAARVISTLAGRKLQCRVWQDVEDSSQKGMGKRLADIINAYMAEIEAAGYECGVYTGLSFYDSYIKPYAALINCPFWIACYPSGSRIQLSDTPATSQKPAVQHTLWGWQYSSTGAVSGISGNVDLNIMYGEADGGGEKAVTENPYKEPVYVLYRHKPMNREYVRWLQYELNEMGYGLAADGLFGMATEKALKDAQKQLGVKVDGKCGPATRSALKKV